MKIGYILNSTLPLGGASKAFRNLLEQLMLKGITPFVVLPDNHGLYNELQNKHIPTLVVCYRNNTYPYLRSPKDYLLFLPRLIARMILNYKAVKHVTEWFANNKVELIHTNVGVVNIGYKAAKKLQLPHIYHLREYGDLDFGMHYFPCKSVLYRQLEQKDSYSICITKAIQQYHKQQGKTSSIVIYDGIFAQKESMPRVEKKSFFLFAGRIEPAKDALFLLQAYAEYFRKSTNPLPLHLAGATNRPDYLSELKRLIANEKLDKHVLFLGERKDLPSLMQHAQAIIIPSHSEGFGFCMPEAMFNGCLAIGRNTAGTKEQMDNGFEMMQGKDIALRFDTQSQLVQLLLEVEQQRPAFQPVVDRAFCVVNKLYTTEESAKNVYSFYKTVLNETAD